MSDSSKNKKKLDRIFLKKGKKLCVYCRKPVHQSRNERPLHPQTATIDHIHSRLDIRRYLIPEHLNTVLSCHKCNDMRNELERLKISMDYSSYGAIHTVMTNIGFEIIPDNTFKI